MRANEGRVQLEKLPYVKPALATHGSVQQLTEGGQHHTAPDCGSNIKLKPSPFSGKVFGDW